MKHQKNGRGVVARWPQLPHPEFPENLLKLHLLETIVGNQQHQFAISSSWAVSLKLMNVHTSSIKSSFAENKKIQTIHKMI